MTSTVEVKDETRTRSLQKAKVNLLPMVSGCTFFKFICWTPFYFFRSSWTPFLYSYNAQIEILLGKTEKFDELMAAAAEEREANETEEQS